MKFDEKNNVFIFENAQMTLTVSENAIAQSLKLKGSDEELLDLRQELALFSVTQARPFNNEVKLSHPNKRTTVPAKKLVYEDGAFTVHFETLPVKARIGVQEEDGFIAFTLLGYKILPEDYHFISITPPPVEELHILQLAVKDRAAYGNWLGVSFDDSAAVCIAAATGKTMIDSEKRPGCHVMYANAQRQVGLVGTTAALIAAPKDGFMDCMDKMERFFGLPLGVESRRTAPLNACIYFAENITPLNVDEHIQYAKQGGFRLMQIYYRCIFHEENEYSFLGDYDYRPEYPNKRDDLVAMLQKIKDAGILPGFHILHTHIGLKSRYVTPRADPRLNITEHFTLVNALPAEDDGKPFDLYVYEDPHMSPRRDDINILKFDTELIHYESFSEEMPYRFIGCRRGDQNTDVVAHPAGQIGGILDVSEFCAQSCYIDQRTNLQDEIAEKLADVFNAGFEFVYFDGSEGTNRPYEYHVPNAQMRVFSKFDHMPLYTEGAAKSHFSWHFLSGGNAFDIFAPEIFKEKIVEFPSEAAPRMRCDFTRLNFGWWDFRAPGMRDGVFSLGTQADHYEFGNSQSAAWDCPASAQARLDVLHAHPRTDDILEVMRRWEDIRAKGLLTTEQKLQLRNPDQEYTLLIAEDGSYELAPYAQIPNAANGNQLLRAFAFTRKGKSYVVYWHAAGEGTVKLPLCASEITLKNELAEDPLALSAETGFVMLPADHKRYVESTLPLDTLIKAFEQAELL